MQRKTPTPNKVRLRRARTDIRQALLESALVEFGAKGFDGASTRAIARRVEAHQPQINYHFESKAALWMAAVDHLFGLLGEAFDGVHTREADRRRSVGARCGVCRRDTSIRGICRRAP